MHAYFVRKKNLFGFTCAIPGTKMIPKKRKNEKTRRERQNFAKTFLHISWPSFVPQVAKIKKEELHNERKSARVANKTQVRLH